MPHFDICLMNPPYDASHHLYMYFLEKAANMCNTLITINPINFIFSKTNKGIHKKLKETINTKSVKIEEVDGNKSFYDASFLSGNDIGVCIFTPKSRKMNVEINFLDGTTKTFDSENNKISKADLNNATLKSIVEKINNYSTKKLFEIFNFLPNYTGFSLRDKIKKFNDDDLFVFLPVKTDDVKNYVYFSNKPNNKRNNVLTVKDKQTSGGIKVDSIIDGKHIIDYLKSDVCRFCYYLSLSGLECGWKGFKLIPIVDFSDKMLFDNSLNTINKKLYELFNLSDDEIEYIQKIISDYYNIR